MVTKQRFVIDEKVYDVVTPATIKHFNFYYNVAEERAGSGTYAGKSMQSGAPSCYWLGNVDSEMKGQEYIWEGDGFPTVVCKLFEWYFWDVDRLGYRFASNQNGWKIYIDPQTQSLFVKMILTGSRGPEVMIVPEKSSAWRRIKRGDYEAGGVNNVDPEWQGPPSLDSITPMIDTDLYVSISRNGTIKTVLLPLDAPFNPKDYASFGTDEGWPLYYVNGRQWKVSWGDSGVAVFTELTKWPEEEDTYITIYQWQLPMSVKTSGNAPFDITEYTPVGITDDGWNLYNVRGVTWKVWAMGGHVQYTEMEDSNKNTNMPIRWTNIIQNGMIWRAVLREDAPFDPNNYQIVDVDADGWPIFLVDRVEWVVKLSYDSTSALPFAKFERRVIERPVDAVVDTIYRNGVAVDVELGSDAPFIPSQQIVAGMSHDGWPEYNIGGRLWKVSSDHGMAVFTEMTWPIEIVEAPSEKIEVTPPEKKEPEVTDQMIPGDREIVETPIKVIENVPDVEVPLSNGSTADSSADLKLEVEYVPFVVLVGLLGIFSIAAQRK